jgi:hypothetical protein
VREKCLALRSVDKRESERHEVVAGERQYEPPHRVASIDAPKELKEQQQAPEVHDDPFKAVDVSGGER